MKACCSTSKEHQGNDKLKVTCTTDKQRLLYSTGGKCSLLCTQLHRGKEKQFPRLNCRLVLKVTTKVYTFGSYIFPSSFSRLDDRVLKYVTPKIQNKVHFLSCSCWNRTIKLSAMQGWFSVLKFKLEKLRLWLELNHLPCMALVKGMQEYWEENSS